MPGLVKFYEIRLYSLSTSTFKKPHAIPSCEITILDMIQRDQWTYGKKVEVLVAQSCLTLQPHEL